MTSDNEKAKAEVVVARTEHGWLIDIMFGARRFTEVSNDLNGDKIGYLDANRAVDHANPIAKTLGCEVLVKEDE